MVNDRLTSRGSFAELALRFDSGDMFGLVVRVFDHRSNSVHAEEHNVSPPGRNSLQQLAHWHGAV